MKDDMSFFELTGRWYYYHNMHASDMLKSLSAYAWLDQPGFRVFSSWRVER